MLRIFPSVNRFLNGTPRLSSLAHADSMSGTEMAMCPNPRPGSALPDA